ncbi:MAG TPA: ornithine--oxo-acid transaminase [Anaerolineales bacterium]|nr:ornithine--oxo-acid transaminase [Anaerolineales bacterium]
MTSQLPTTPSEFIALDETYSAHNYHPLDVVISRAEGIWLYDVNGKRYLDCLSAYSAVNQGHCHPAIVQALVAQAHKVTITSRAFRNDQMGLFLQKLCNLIGYEMALPMNSGAEAVETAIKAVRKWGYQHKGIPTDQAEIIVCDGNFHGRTTTIIGFSSEAQYRADFGPFAPGFVRIPYGDLNALQSAINPRTAGFLVEPIQGEGGVIVPSAGYLSQAAALCRANQVLLVADEIQTGLGRTGKWLASAHEGVRPDVVILGKALGGGVYPVSAVLADRAVLGLFRPGDHGSTFGGNPLAAAVGQAALQVLQDEHLVERSAELGEYLRVGLQRIESDLIREIRGKGLMIGMELSERARPYCEALRDKGLLCKETHENVIRFAPPLIIGKTELDWVIEQVEQVLVGNGS